MGIGQGGAARTAAARESSAAVAWRDAAEQVRRIVSRLPMPNHVAAYLRGYADSLGFHCALGAPAECPAGDVVGARAGRLAAYAREPASASSAGVAAQRTAIETAARSGRFSVVSWHEDGEGHGRNRRTSGLQDARAAVRAGEAGGIVVSELARLGRNSLDVLDLVERSSVEGCRLIALDCRLDSATPSGAIVVETLRAARRLAWRKTSASRPSDPRRDRAARRPAAAATDVEPAVAARIAAMRRAGESYRAIAAALNDDGVAASGESRWGAASVRGVLQAMRGGR